MTRWMLLGATIGCTILILFTLFTSPPPRTNTPEIPGESPPHYTSEWYDKAFYDQAYERAQGTPLPNISSALVAHHLLVADAIAEVFEDIENSAIDTVILVSPNHFSRGLTPIQISSGSWETAYGTVSSVPGAADAIAAIVSYAAHEETAFSREHGIYNLMSFIARSFPQAQVIPIVVKESLTPQQAWAFGSVLADLYPNAIFLASIDMTHEQPQDMTAKNDAHVLEELVNTGRCDSSPCNDDLRIDSNASMRVLFGWNDARNTTQWNLTRHDSSLELGFARDASENVSHILGYFLPNEVLR